MKKLIGLIVGCGLAAAVALPALACPFTSASNADQPPQQTAQAQSSQDADKTAQ